MCLIHAVCGLFLHLVGAMGFGSLYLKPYKLFIITDLRCTTATNVETVPNQIHTFSLLFKVAFT